VSTFTEQDKYYHFEYESMSSDARKNIDSAYKAARNSLRDSGLKTSNDDRAEALVAAIARYVMASGNEF
jgi:hypothetical protein